VCVIGTRTRDVRVSTGADPVGDDRSRDATFAGVVVGTGAGLLAATVATTPTRHPVAVGLAYLSALVIGRFWGRLLTATVAPLLLRNGQRTARVGYVAVQTTVFAVSAAVPYGSTTWGVVAALLVAAPWWISAVVESRRPVPAYPAEWTRFDSG
jgi:hypothetical protein